MRIVATSRHFFTGLMVLFSFNWSVFNLKFIFNLQYLMGVLCYDKLTYLHSATINALKFYQWYANFYSNNSKCYDGIVFGVCTEKNVLQLKGFCIYFKEFGNENKPTMAAFKYKINVFKIKLIYLIQTCRETMFFFLI